MKPTCAAPDGCTEPIRGRGPYCNKHRLRIQAHGTLELQPRKRRPEIERWWSYVDIGEPDECWPWIGQTNRYGYGKFTADVDGVWRKVGSHRWGYEALIGPLGDLQVRHTCDNPPCCNPAHWLRGTPKDNVRDRIERGRSAHPKGQMHPMAKFTDAQATEIVRRRMSGEGNNALAREFGVSPTTICSMVHGRTWAHISLPPHQIEVQPPAGTDV